MALSDAAKVGAVLALGAALGAGGLKAARPAPLPPSMPLPSICFSPRGPPLPCGAEAKDAGP